MTTAPAHSNHGDIRAADAPHGGGDAPATAVETHISRLFFGGDRVYKLLKAVSYDYLDHSTPERRAASIEAEYELNRRLAPDVYLGTADLYEHGEISDRMLIMRRLPEDRKLSALVDQPDFVDRLRRIAHDVAAFHASAPPVAERWPMTSADGLLGLWNSSFDDIAPWTGSLIPVADHDRTRLLATEYLEHSTALFDRRRRDGLVRDGHGDLTADDIFVLDDGPRILDCLAFDPAYRISDVLADVAFLVMDVERLAGPEPARQLMQFYCEFSGEHHPSSLAHHYVAYRAHVRCKVALQRYAQGDEGSAHVAARRHSQTLDHLVRARRRVILVGGGPGAGKSTVARALADRFNWSVIDSDTLRKDLRGVDHDDHEVDDHPELYTEGTTDDTYATLCRHAGLLLDAGESVVIDATWSDGDHRALVRRLATEHGAGITEFECRVDPGLARERIAQRRRDGHDASDATPELVVEMARRRHPWPEAVGLDTGSTLDAVVDEAARAVFDDSPPSPRFAT